MSDRTDAPTLTELWRAEALREQAIRRCEQLASQLTVARVAIHQLSKSSGRNFDRLIAAEHRAEIAEAALASSSSRPARVANLLRRTMRLLVGLPDPCASCRLSGQHRYNCRVDALARAIHNELEPFAERGRDRLARQVASRSAR